MGKFIIFVHATADSEAGKLPTTQELKEMSDFNTQLVNAGVMLAGEGLLQSSKGARITYSDSEPVVQKGTFLSNNLVAGYWVLTLDNIEEAISWAKKIPFKTGSVEIRKMAEAEDFWEPYTDELKEKEKQLRKKAEEIEKQ